MPADGPEYPRTARDPCTPPTNGQRLGLIRLLLIHKGTISDHNNTDVVVAVLAIVS